MVEALTVARLLGGAVLLLANGFFVTTEFAMTRVRQFDEEQFAGAGLERAWAMTEELEIYLSGCQVGITISSVGLGVVAEPAVTAVAGPALSALGLGAASGGHTALSVGLSLALINLLHLVIGEQAPTYLGVERTRLVARYGAEPLYLWTKLMWPVIVVADRLAKGLLGLLGVSMTRAWTDEEPLEGDGVPSRAETRRQMGETLAAQGVDAERRDEVLRALDIGHVPVEAVMVDREDVIALSTERSGAESLERVRETPHSRFPLVGGTLDEFEGVVYTPALLRSADALEAGEASLAELAAPPMTVEADTPVSEVIDAFQAASQELALVERDGEVVGLVTATDCFEAIAGQLEDPLDDELDAA